MSMTSKNGIKPRCRPRRWLKISGGAVLVLGLASCVLANRLVSEAIVHPARKGVGAPLPEGLTARTFKLPDGVEIRTWEARPAEKPKAAVLVLHGVADSKATHPALPGAPRRAGDGPGLARPWR
jgi:hypothetical protein